MPVVRLIHTADLHLDTSFAAEGLSAEKAKQCRSAQRATLRAILDRAVAWPADAVLIAGDLFESTRLSQESLGFLQEAFAAVAPLPIFIAPGKADPYASDAPYAQEPWPANVTIFRNTTWERHDLPALPLSVHGVACTGDTPSRNPFVDFQVPREDRVQIGLVYAAEESRLPLDARVQTIFNAAEITNTGLDYLALGYAHEQVPLENEGNTLACYPGAPHGLGFNAVDSGHYLEVELDVGVPPTIRPVETNTLSFKEATLDVSECLNFTALLDALEPVLPPLDDTAMSLLRLHLCGSVDWLVSATLPMLRERLRDRLHFLEIIDQVDSRAWYLANTDAQTSAGLFLQRMTREIQDAPDAKTREKLLCARSLGMAALRDDALAYEHAEGDIQ